MQKEDGRGSLCQFQVENGGKVKIGGNIIMYPLKLGS